MRKYAGKGFTSWAKQWQPSDVMIRRQKRNSWFHVARMYLMNVLSSRSERLTLHGSSSLVARKRLSRAKAGLPRLSRLVG
ncbi:hypothetical protein DIE14_20630 [Burkholderia sp. Bp9017]|nr:hypothetical protein DIE14_20630 [Burkholderia sp. Bp9017]RQZ32575.1 hypothetical protein DIE13_20165 [Burkholderia sp. Bp9016]